MAVDLSDLQSDIDNIRPDFGLENNIEDDDNENNKNDKVRKKPKNTAKSKKGANPLAEGEKVSNSNNSQDLAKKESNPSLPGFSYTGSGKKQQPLKKGMKKLSLKALFALTPVLIFVIIISAVAVISIGAIGLLPGAVDENSQEAFDVQYPALAKTFQVLMKSMLANGSVPSPFVDRLADAGMEVGYFDENNNFIAGLRPNSENSVALASKTSDPEEEKDNSLVVKFKGNIFNATEFAKTIETDTEAFAAFETATFGRALAHYDDNATSFYSTIKASRNVFENYEATADIEKDTENFHKIFSEVFEVHPQSTFPSGSRVIENEVKNALAGLSLNHHDELVDFFIDAAMAAYAGPWKHEETAANLAMLVNNVMNANETYYAMHYYLTIEESISKIKAGDSAASPINPVLNFLTETSTSEVADVESGNFTKVTGTAVQSSGLSSVLTKNYPSTLASEVKNYTSDWYMKAGKKIVSDGTASTAIKKTPASSTNDQAPEWIKDFSYSYGGILNKLNIIIGELVVDEVAEMVQLFAPILDKSTLYENVTGRVSGTTAGEYFSKGGAALGQHIATFAQGGTTGDENAIVAYDSYSEKVIAMENAADRLKRSPFDITSKNTFLGSVFASINNNIISSDSLFSTFSTFSNLTGNSLLSVLPGAFAANNEQNKKTYQTSFSDNCPALDYIESKGDIYCNPTITFDIDTIENALGSAEFEKFLDKNLVAVDSSEVTTPKSVNLAAKTTVDITVEDSYLDDMTNYNNARSSQFGVKDLSVYQAALAGSTVSYSESPEDTDPEDEWDQSARDKSSGKAFRNSSSNGEWEQYKYAQAYMTYERALKQMEYFSSDNKNEASLSKHFIPGTDYSPVSNQLALVAEDIQDDSDAEYLARISGISVDDAEMFINLYSYASYLASLDYSRYCMPSESNCNDLPEEKILQNSDTTLATAPNFITKNSSYYKKQEANTTA